MPGKSRVISQRTKHAYYENGRPVNKLVIWSLKNYIKVLALFIISLGQIT